MRSVQEVLGYMRDWVDENVSPTGIDLNAMTSKALHAFRMEEEARNEKHWFWSVLPKAIEYAQLQWRRRYMSVGPDIALDDADAPFAVWCTQCDRPMVIEAFRAFSDRQWGKSVKADGRRPFFFDLPTGTNRLPSVTVECPGCNSAQHIGLAVIPLAAQREERKPSGSSGNVRALDDLGTVPVHQPSAELAVDELAARRQRLDSRCGLTDDPCD